MGLALSAPGTASAQDAPAPPAAGATDEETIIVTGFRANGSPTRDLNGNGVPESHNFGFEGIQFGGREPATR